ncbi:MAG: hypothetical protein HC906_19890 [Bacteroidales bacterium]|nr:hypothetical protein [Bacteroidales bacterium]
MKRVDLSIMTWGIYLICLGMSMIIIPLKVVAMFGFAGTEDLWIRFAGILSAVLGLYYIQIAVKSISALYLWKVAGHVFGLVCMVAFILTDVADMRILGTIFFELLACLWTVYALRSSPRKAVQAV